MAKGLSRRKTTAVILTLIATSVGVRVYLSFKPKRYEYSDATTSNCIVGTNTSRMDNCTAQFKHHHFMEFSEPKGRVGNQLFQLLMLLATADKYCYTPLLWTFKMVLGDIFELPYSKIDVSKAKFCWKEFKVETNEYVSSVNDLDTNANWRFDGYFQNWNYFYSKAKVLKSKLQFKSEILTQVQYFFTSQMLNKDINVCVHVRRGDFLKSENVKLGYAVIGPSYLNRSMTYFKNKYENIGTTNFIYLSNDIKWCKTNIEAENVYFSPFSSSSDYGPGMDLALMAMCNHTIITSGSFGWMGAWLSGGDVIYFSGFPKPGSWVDTQIIKEQYYLPHWIAIE